MDQLLKSIGCSTLVVLQYSEDGVWRIGRILRGSASFDLNEREGDVSDIAGILSEALKDEDEIVLLMWDGNESEDRLSMKFHLSRMTDAWVEIYSVEKLLRLIYPVLPDYQWESVKEYFSVPPGENRNVDTADVFLSLIAYLSRVDLSLLNDFARLYSGSDHPEYQLVVRVGQYVKDQTVSYYPYPAPCFPPMPVNIIGEAVEIESGGRNAVPLSQAVRRWFAPDGKLSRGLPGFEWRKEQLALSLKIAEAFTGNTFLLAEAGTGTGKSLAYLVPAYLTATAPEFSGETIVISTHTKNLQDQLFYKDIPILLELADRPFRAVLLKGRGNYLCLNRWWQVIREPTYYLSPAEQDALLPLLFWQRMTRTGDIGEVTALPAGFTRFLWEKLNSDRRHCHQQHCRFTEQCPVRTIRESARRAQLTIVNHSLLFSDIHTDHSILGEYHHLIVDEAHQLEKVAQQYLGVEFSIWAIRSLLSHLYERDRFETGLLIQMKAAVHQSDLTEAGKKSINELLERATEACVQTWIEIQRWFQEITVKLADMSQSLETRDSYNGRKKVRYRGHEPIWTTAINYGEDWVKWAVELHAALDNLSLHWTHQNLNDYFGTFDFVLMLETRKEEIRNLMEAFQTLMCADDENVVYWYELPVRERSYDTRFYGVPLDIAGRLQDVLFSRLKTCIFSSATLSVAGSFQFFQSRVGLNGSLPVNAYTAGSSFDFQKQCKVIIPDYLPDPSRREFPDAVAKIIRETAETFNKGMLVLFTSYQMMRQVYDSVEEDFRREGILLLMQGQDSSRTALTQRFRATLSSVLFGTDSFWEGVDVPGEALEILVITKLPFEVPSEPLVAAKMEQIEKNGGNAFFDYSLPEAVIKFRQGFGRLIRHKQDRGVVLLLDNRLTKKNYGRWFTQSLPVPAEIARDEHQLFAMMNSFFESFRE